MPASCLMTHFRTGAEGEVSKWNLFMSVKKEFANSQSGLLPFYSDPLLRHLTYGSIWPIVNNDDVKNECTEQ